jgi:glycosyltransferase involved in cell wall biosynthesis
VIEDALIIIPAFNEAAVLGETLRELQDHARHLLVVDDGSQDQTAAVARASGARCLRLPTNLNDGGALQAGFRYALRKTEFPAFLTFDADGQHDPAALPSLLKPLQEGRADYVLGSRFLAGQPEDLPLPRRVGIRLFAAAASWVLGQRITDPTTGLLGVGREVARMFLSQLFPQDYPDADVLIMLGRMGFRILEVPVVMRPSRRAGSMHGGILRPAYYLAKMSTSMIHLAARGDLLQKRREAHLVS